MNPQEPLESTPGEAPSKAIVRNLQLPAVLNQGPFGAVVHLSAAAVAAEDTIRSAYTKLFEWALRAEKAYAPNTLLAWRSDWKCFSRYCLSRGLQPLPALPETVEEFIQWLTALENRPSAIVRTVSTISRAHQGAEVTNPCVTQIAKLALRTMRRALKVRQEQARGLTWKEIDRYLQQPAICLRDHRDRALVAVAYDSMCRESEVVAFNVEDFSWMLDGSGCVSIPQSKADQEGEGAIAYLSPMSVRLIRTWLKASGIKSGAVFVVIVGKSQIGERLRAKAVAERLRRVAQWIGLPDEECAGTSGHSTRVGGAQDLCALGIELPGIMQAGRWTDSRQVIRYTQHLLAGRGAMARAAKAQGRT